MFENITIPVYQSQYVRNPIQIGDVGVTKKIDLSLYPLTQQFGKLSPPNFTDGGNYGAIMGFMPISSKATFPTTADAAQTWIYGIQGHGVKITDIEGSSVKIMGRDFVGHEHSNVQTGTSNTGGVV